MKNSGNLDTKELLESPLNIKGVNYFIFAANLKLCYCL